MLTCCTNCHAQFEINDRLVREDDARVRCGECQTEFDARRNLIDRYSGMPYLLPEDELAMAQAGDEFEDDWDDHAIGNRGFSSSAHTERRSAAQALEFDRTSALTGVEPGYSDFRGRSETRSRDNHCRDSLDNSYQPDPRTGGGKNTRTSGDQYDLELPPRSDIPELQAEAAQPGPNTDVKEKNASSGFLLSGLAGLLLVAGVISMLFGWKDRIAVLPLPQPVLQAFCAVTGCQLQEERDIAQLQLLQKKIYTHPSVDGALIVSLDLINNADFEQIYPQLSIKMADETGATVAQRSFSPNEYLSDQFAEQKLIPGKPVRIQLELMDPGVDARTFELGFE